MKEIAITDDLKESHITLLAAQAEYKRINEDLEPIEKKILDEVKLAISKNITIGSRLLQKRGEAITCLDDSYLASEEDLVLFFDMCHEAYLRKGYEVEKHQSPILIAKSKLIDAENKFIDESFYLVHDTGLRREDLCILAIRREYLKRSLNLASRVVKQEDNRLKKVRDLCDEVKKCHSEAVQEEQRCFLYPRNVKNSII